MKLTKAKIKAFEDEDREIIAQTEADIAAGRMGTLPLPTALQNAIRKAAREAVERHRMQTSGSARVTVHVKPKPGKALAKTTARAAKTVKAKAVVKPAEKTTKPTAKAARHRPR